MKTTEELALITKKLVLETNRFIENKINEYIPDATIGEGVATTMETVSTLYAMYIAATAETANKAVSYVMKMAIQSLVSKVMNFTEEPTDEKNKTH